MNETHDEAIDRHFQMYLQQLGSDIELLLTQAEMRGANDHIALT